MLKLASGDLMGNSPSRIHVFKYLANAVLLAISLALGLLIMEASLTLYYGSGAEPGKLIIPEGARSPYLFEAEPRSSFVENDVEYRLNNLGMRRSKDVLRTSSEETMRILSYGDSIANGWGIPEDSTYSHLLEMGLQEHKDQSYEILNMYRGVAPTLASFHIRGNLPILEPRGVVLEIELLNDISDEALIRTEGRDENGLPTQIRTSRYIVGWDGHLLSGLYLRGTLVERTKSWASVSRLIGTSLSAMKEKGIKRTIEPVFTDDSGAEHYFYNLGFDRFLLTEEATDRAFDQMFASIVGISRFLRSHDTSFLLVILPSKYAYEPGPFQQASLRQLRRAEDRAREMKLPYVSLYESYLQAGGQDLFMDFCHPTRDGNRVIADEIFPVVSRW